MNVILHIGTEKTASSSIQKFLHENRTNLPKNGFYFMRSSGVIDDRKLSAYCLMENEYDDFHKNNNISNLQGKKEFEEKFKEEYTKEISNLSSKIHTVVISSEHFHSRVRRNNQRLKLQQFLSTFFDKVTIIVYLRSQIEVCISHYSTYLKSKGINDLRKHLHNCKKENYYYNYEEVLNGWQEDFNKSKFIVRLYDKRYFISNDIIQDFCHAIDLNYKNLKSVSASNQSVNPTGQELLKIFNLHFHKLIKNDTIIIKRMELLRLINELFVGKGQMPPSSQAQEIQSKFDIMNANICKKWFPNQDSLFDINYQKFDQVEIVDWDIVNSFKELLQEIPLNDAKSLITEKIKNLLVELEKVDSNSIYIFLQLSNVLIPNNSFVKKKLRIYNIKMNLKNIFYKLRQIIFKKI